MRIRRLPQVVAALTTLVAPLAALAQSTNGSVTTAPFASVPLMGMPVLILLAVVLAGTAAYFLRPAAGRAIAVVGFVATLTTLVGLGYAKPGEVKVQGGQCGMQTTQMFDPLGQLLVSHCPNSIQIVAIEDTCGLNFCAPGMCTVGQVLSNGESCMLPSCK